MLYLVDYQKIEFFTRDYIFEKFPQDFIFVEFDLTSL